MKVIGVAFAVASIGGAFACRKPRHTPAAPPEATPTLQPGAQGPQTIGAAPARLTDQSRFDHTRAEHKKQQCTLCHVRADNSVTPVFPGHSACISCHANDFTAPATSKLCVVCHVTPLAAKPQIIAFRSTLYQFGLTGFSHAQHMDPAKMAGEKLPKCDDCHHPSGAASQPGFPGHSQCYSCHVHQAGQKLSGCDACHAGLSVAMVERKGPGSAATLYRFTHAGHLNQASVAGNCSKCHHVTAAAALAAAVVVQTGNSAPALADMSQINTARGQRHTSACWTCHVQAREPLCTKCHVGGPPL